MVEACAQKRSHLKQEVEMTLLRLGAMLRDRRGGRGIRQVAQEIGISSATLTRVEGGRLPEIATFQKICSWLKVNPAEILDIPTDSNPTSTDALVAAVHLRADQPYRKVPLQIWRN
jgi:transcriptional regulator with XRE-family HTH domain